MNRYFLPLFTIIYVTAYAWAGNITGTGYGLTKEAAIEQAKRDAVEKGLGSYISSETIVTETSLSDNIYSKATGFVKSFSITKEKEPQEKENTTVVTGEEVNVNINQVEPEVERVATNQPVLLTKVDPVTISEIAHRIERRQRTPGRCSGFEIDCVERLTSRPDIADIGQHPAGWGKAGVENRLARPERESIFFHRAGRQRHCEHTNRNGGNAGKQFFHEIRPLISKRSRLAQYNYGATSDYN